MEQVNPTELSKKLEQSKRNVVLPVLLAIVIICMVFTTFLPIYIVFHARSVAKNFNQSQSDVVMPTIILSPVSPQPTKPFILPTPQAFSCNLSHQQDCATIQTIKSAIDSENFEVLKPYLQLKDYTCQNQPDNPYVPAECNGKPDGTVIPLFTVGYNASEGYMASPENTASSLKYYVEKNGPFHFQSAQFEDQDPYWGSGLNYLSADGRSMMDISFTKENGAIKVGPMIMLGVSNEWLNSQSH